MSVTKIYCHRASDIPAGEHWAIITSRSVSIPGDERSRTAPGHGYPAHSEHFVQYVSYTNQAEFEADLLAALGDPNSSARGFHVQGAYRQIRKLELAAPEPTP